MSASFAIGAVARESGVPIRTIRFYESKGVIPRPERTRAGYRLYGPNDVRRLRLIKNARLLGLALPDAKELVEQAFASDCQSFAPELSARIAEQRRIVSKRIADLRVLHADLKALEQHVMHAHCASEPGRLVVDCGYCPLIDEEEKCDGESSSCGSD